MEKFEGKQVDITKERVQELAQEIDKFVGSIAEQIERLDDENPLF